MVGTEEMSLFFIYLPSAHGSLFMCMNKQCVNNQIHLFLTHGHQILMEHAHTHIYTHTHADTQIDFPILIAQTDQEKCDLG